MKNLPAKFELVYLLLILFIPLFSITGQTKDTTKTDKNSLIFINQTKLDTIKSNISFNGEWKYHPGDDSSWAEKNYNDASWTKLKNNFYMDSIKTGTWKGIGWFRKKFRIDSTMFYKPVAFIVSQFGASEFYLNGKLVKKFGTIGTDVKEEKDYNPHDIPFTVVFDTSKIQVLAVRFANRNAQVYYDRYINTADFAGFSLAINKNNHAILSQMNDKFMVTILFTAIGAIAFAFALLHLLIFFFYSRQRENLFYGLFAAFLTLHAGWLLYTHTTHLVSDLGYIIYSSGIIWISLMLATYNFFLYAIFYKKMPKQFWVILLLGAALSFLVLFVYLGNFWGYVYLAFILLLAAEGLRVIILAIKRKKKNAAIIGTGVLILFLFSLFIVITGITEISLPYWLVISIFGFGLLSLPISMAIYLARESARTKSDLENRIVEVEDLSEKTIEQEKREAELRVENTRKETELQKAAELKTAYENLENAHENLKSMQQQLITQEKLASLGQLTAGIAHEIKNPLNFVNNFSEVSSELIEEIREELKHGNEDEALEIVDDIKLNLDKINHHGKRADSIIKGMLLHSRGTSGERALTDINNLLDEYVNLAYHGMRAKDKEFNITIEKDYDETLEKINVVPQDISRVFLNMINNACYAANEKKKKSGDNFSPTLKVSTKNSKDKVEIRIGDNGNGIPDKIKDKLFQPFFTTKPTGEGTGLGLSLSYDIVVKQHGGEIKIESEEGKGAEFVISLPLE
jgi:signal transduction histidine kinase